MCVGLHYYAHTRRINVIMSYNVCVTAKLRFNEMLQLRNFEGSKTLES